MCYCRYNQKYATQIKINKSAKPDQEDIKLIKMMLAAGADANLSGSFPDPTPKHQIDLEKVHTTAYSSSLHPDYHLRTTTYCYYLLLTTYYRSWSPSFPLHLPALIRDPCFLLLTTP